MIPGYFREFDRVARESFGFLVSEKPTVEFWRDYYWPMSCPTIKEGVSGQNAARECLDFGVASALVEQIRQVGNALM